MRISDWSSDVCSSDLVFRRHLVQERAVLRQQAARLHHPPFAHRAAHVAREGQAELALRAVALDHLGQRLQAGEGALHVLAATAAADGFLPPAAPPRSEKLRGRTAGVRTCKLSWLPCTQQTK